MTNWQIYVTWGLLAFIVFAVTGLSKQVERFREEFQEFRELMRPSEPEEPELSAEDAAKAGSFWRE
jgi:hypothetical protein